MTNSYAEMGEQIVLDFVAEAREMLELVEPEMLSAKMLDKDLANRIFRPLHTIKGIAGSFGFNTISMLTHNAETLLTIIREQSLATDNPDHISVFLRTFDLTREILKKIEHEKNDNGFEIEIHKLIEQLSAITEKLKTMPSATEGPKKESKDRASTYNLEITPDMLDAFKTESLEAFGIIEHQLLTLVNNPNNTEAIHETFRNIHSFKGNCGIFGFVELENLSHKMENLLADVKSGKTSSDPLIYELIMNIVDNIRSALGAYTLGSSNLVIAGYKDFLDKLVDLDPINALHLFEDEEKEQKEAEQAAIAEAAAKTEKSDAQVARGGVMETTFSPAPNATPSSASGPTSPTNDKRLTIETQKDLRVSTEKLDILNNLMGELVTAKTMLTASILRITEEDSTNKEELEKSLNYISKTINDLQDVAVDIRMIPIAGLFKKMMRIVHDLSVKSRKNVNLSFFGQETEIDKTIVEKISDPLVHMVRNAIDHGLENEEDRLAAGKPKIGTVSLGAKQEAGEIWVIVEDDGRGLNKTAILTKAKNMGILKDGGESLTDKQIYNLIFHAGLSTAEKITDISGRGVGMDVVMQNINELRGTVDIHTTPGKGSQFIIKLPLTLAIIDGMQFRVSEVTYILPIESIQEIVKVTKDEIDSIVQDQQCIMVRGRLIPVVVLSKLHNLISTVDTESGVILVITSKGNTIALLVDSITGQQQTVVKPIPKYFSTLRGISGCTILGNGEISLILDVGQLIEIAVAA